MALSSGVLAASIKSNLLTLSYVIDDSKLDDFTTKIAEAIIDHIVNNAVVTTTSGAPDAEHIGVVT